MSATKLATLSPAAIPSPDKTIEWCHINRVEIRVRLLELVRGRAIDHPASELGHSEELLREWREAFRLVEQGRLRLRVAFEEVNRGLVVPDVALKLQRARLLLCRRHKLWSQRRELVHLITVTVNSQYTCSLRIPASMVRRLKAHTTTTIGATANH
jgi:hypothetical protein